MVHQRYGINNSILPTNRSLTPQTLSNLAMHPPNVFPSQQQQSPVSNQVRLISNTHSVPSSYVAGNINLAQTTPTSVFSSYHYQQEQQQQPPMLVLPTQNFPIAQLAQCFNSQPTNGVLKDRNNQQQQQQVDKRTRSFKEPIGSSLSTVKEMQPLPIHEGQVRIKWIAVGYYVIC